MADEPKPAAEFWTRERCLITELFNDASVPDVSVARCRVKPGITTERHALSVAEWYVVESGRGLMYLGDEPAFAVGAGDTVGIAAGREQRIANCGEDDLLFLCVCVPRFTPETYTARE